MLRFLIILIAIVGSSAVLADPPVGLGDFAESMIAPVGVLSKFISTAAIIIGVGCLFGAFLRYTQFRVNPVAAPISSVLVLLFLGLLLLGLPLLNIALGYNMDFLQQ